MGTLNHGQEDDELSRIKAQITRKSSGKPPFLVSPLIVKADGLRSDPASIEGQTLGRAPESLQ